MIGYRTLPFCSSLVCSFRHVFSVGRLCVGRISCLSHLPFRWVTAVLLVLSSACFVSNALAASSDFDGDGKSDVAAVTGNEPLSWTAILSQQGVKVQIEKSFGNLGVHIASGRYSGAAETDVAIVNEKGNWRILATGGKYVFNHGADGATYISGADANGNGIDDAIYFLNGCSNKKIEVRGLSDPAFDLATTFGAFAGSGRFPITFGDANGDWKDDICYLIPQRKRKKPKQFTGKFKMRCLDMATSARIATFNVREVYGTPLPLRVADGQPNYFVFPREVKSENRTDFVVRSPKGEKIAEFSIPVVGNVLIGNYTNPGGPEQVAVATDGALYLRDLTSGAFATIAAPSGIHFDEININRFGSNDCYCHTGTIGKNGKCEKTNNGGGGGGSGSGGSGEVGESCEVIRDSSGGYLYKPVSDTTGRPVILLPEGEDAASCRFENSSGKVLQDLFEAGIANGGRQHWRPSGGGGCGSYPNDLVVSCAIKGKRNCWSHPRPCQRYE